MSEIVAERMDEDFLQKVDQLGDEEVADRSTVIRQLLSKGYKEHLREKAARLYREGAITFSEAARRGGVNLWEMQQYLVEKGFKSQYAIEDLERELRSIKKKK
jgi:predicted HTH domain antitoxin